MSRCNKNSPAQGKSTPKKKTAKSSRARKYNYFEKNGRFYRVRAPRARPSGDRHRPRQQAPGNERPRLNPIYDWNRKTGVYLPYLEDYQEYPQWVETSRRRRRSRRHWTSLFLYTKKYSPLARPPGDRHHSRQKAPSNEHPHPNPLYDWSQKSRICLPYLEDYQEYSEWVESSRRRRSGHYWTSVFLYIKKHTPRHAPAAPSGRVGEKPSSLPTHQLPSSLTSLPVRARHPPVNVDNNDDCGKILHGTNPSAPAAQEDQVKLHESSDATTPLQDETNIESGSGISNTGLTTLEERFEGLEVDWTATDDRSTSREFALATEVEENLRNGDLSDGEDIE